MAPGGVAAAACVQAVFAEPPTAARVPGGSGAALSVRTPLHAGWRPAEDTLKLCEKMGM